MRFTPPPPELVRAQVLEGVRARAQMAADALRLSGAATLRALMHAEYADLVVVEAEAFPDLSPGSDLFQQVRARLGRGFQVLKGFHTGCCSTCCPAPSSSSRCARAGAGFLQGLEGFPYSLLPDQSPGSDCSSRCTCIGSGRW